MRLFYLICFLITLRSTNSLIFSRFYLNSCSNLKRSFANRLQTKGIQRRYAIDASAEDSSVSLSHQSYNTGSDIDEAIRHLDMALQAVNPGQVGLIDNIGAKSRDSSIESMARTAGVRLDKFEGRGIEQQAYTLLSQYLNMTKREGFLSSMLSRNSDLNYSLALPDLMALGASMKTNESHNDRMVGLHLRSILDRGNPDLWEDLNRPPMEIVEEQPAGRASADLLVGPPEWSKPHGLPGLPMRPNPATEFEDRNKLETLVGELVRALSVQAPIAQIELILDSNRQLLMSPNLILLLREKNATETDAIRRSAYIKIAKKAMDLVSQLAEFVATESERHLQTVYAICEISAKYQHDENDFLRRIKALSPLFDTQLLSFLSYSLEIEKQALLRAGINPSQSPSSWLQILTVVHKGVLAEFRSRFQRIIDPVIISLRFPEPEIREGLFSACVNRTHPMELRYLKQLTQNMIDGVMDMDENGPNLEQSVAECYSSVTGRSYSMSEKLIDLRKFLDKYLEDEVIEGRVNTFKNILRSQGQEVGETWRADNEQEFMKSRLEQ